MDRIYGDHYCHMCGKVSNLGWVYACKQDDLQSKLSVSEPEALPVVPDSGNYFETQAKVAESLGTLSLPEMQKAFMSFWRHPRVHELS